MDAKIRVYHDVALGPDVDIYIGEYMFLSNISFNVLSNYMAVPPHISRIQVTLAGEQEVIIDRDVILNAGSNNTIVVHGDIRDLSSLNLLVIRFEENSTNLKPAKR